MHLSNIFAHWSAHLRQRGNDDSLAFDQHGMLSLLAGKQRIDCRVAPESLILRARICGMPDHQSSADQHAWLCRILTLTNTHAHSRREFPVLTKDRTLELHAWIGVRADYAAFCAAFDQYIDALDAWRHALLASADRSPPASSRPGGAPFTSFTSAPSDISQATL